MSVDPLLSSRVFVALRPYQIVLSHLVLEQEQAQFGQSASAHLICNVCGTTQGDKLLIDNDSWSQVHNFPATSSLLRARSVVDHWASERFDAEQPVTTYASNDTHVATQLLLSFFRERHLVLMEDGIGSYVPNGWNNSLTRRLVRSVLYKPLFGARYFNATGLATTTSERYYALSDRAFPRIAPPSSALRKIQVKGSRYLDALRSRLAPTIAEAFGDRPVYLILSEPYLENSSSAFAAVAQEFARKICETAPQNAFVWFKRHPTESAAEVTSKRKRLEALLRDDLVIGDPPECTFPAELSSLLGIELRGVYGTLSSGLLNIRLLDERVPVFAYYGLLGEALLKHCRSYIDVMNEAGVNCPFS